MENTACLKGAPVKLTAFFASLLICGVAAARDVGPNSSRCRFENLDVVSNVKVTKRHIVLR